MTHDPHTHKPWRPCALCDTPFEPRPKGSPGRADCCRSCARTCRRCGLPFTTTEAERAAQDSAVRKHAVRVKRGKLGAIPDTLPRLCVECRPATKAAKPAKGGNVLAIGGRR